MTKPGQLPPAIVWGLETQIGVNIVRELGRYGIPVIGLGMTKRSIGFASRYLAHGEIAKPCGHELIDQINALSTRFGAQAVMTVAEPNLKFLAEQRHLLKARAIAPDPKALAIVLDKQSTLAIAGRHGIDIPRSLEIHSADEIDAVAGTLPFPVVLKWSDVLSVNALLQGIGSAVEKFRYVYGEEEFRSVMHGYDAIQRWPLVQQYCPGHGFGQFFFMHQGRALRRFQHYRLAEWPPEGGTSVVCEAVPLSRHAELQEKSIALLREIGWEGVAMVEYKYDPDTGKAYLMEINGRFWGSFPLAVHCGAGFALYAYFVQGQGKPLELPEPRANLRCRALAPEIRRLLRILFKPELIQNRSLTFKLGKELLGFAGNFLNPRCRYFLLAIDDIGPSLKDLLNAVQSRIPFNE